LPLDFLYYTENEKKEGSEMRILLMLKFMLLFLVGTTFALPQLSPTSLPYSWEKGGVRATLIGTKSLSTNLGFIGLRGVDADKGYKFIGVHGSYENLTHRGLSYVEIRDGGPHFPIFELETNRGNIYKHSFKGGVLVPPSNGLRPEEKIEHWEVFEIRQDEEPVSLYGLEFNKKTGKWHTAYVWEIKDLI